jgi:hypothetical protein
LTSAPTGRLKTPDQKTITTPQATPLKACSQLLPRYPQPVPQQTGTSQNPAKTTDCSGFMPRFGSLRIMFSTISGNGSLRDGERLAWDGDSADMMALPTMTGGGIWG